MDRMLSRNLIVLCLLLLNSSRGLYGQTLPTPDLTSVNPPSPNAASLGQFGTYPVTLYNGLVDISIPVYDIKTPRLDMPIRISYHASGIKVTDVASWVGLGWALNGGGEITRTVVGNADDRLDGYLSSSNTIRLASSLSLTTSSSDISYVQNLINKQIDGQPDLFSYMYPGGSGNFLFNVDKTTLIHIPMDKDSIMPDLPNNRFTIIDAKGNTYVFGTALDGSINYETSTTYTNGTSTYAITAWMLTNVISADKTDTITLKYAHSSSSSYDDIYNYMTISDEYQPDGCSTSGGIFPCAYKSDEGYDTEMQGSTYSENTVCKLSEIDYKNGKILFLKASGGRLDQSGDTALQKIVVYGYDYPDRSYVPVKTVTLYQSYYNNNDRLRLDSLEITGNGISQPETYSFGYDPTLLPAPTSVQKDYWGYYNNNPGSTLLPQMQFYFSNGGGSGYITVGDADRSADTARVRACSLERINYPTGGYTQLVYQSNEFLLNNVVTYGGGLRIAEILNYDGVSPVPQRTFYTYGTAEDGYGEFNAPPTNLPNLATYSSVVNGYNYCPTCNGGGLETVRETTLSSTPNFNFIPLDGSAVFYPTVTEYKGDSEGSQGKTVYQYEYAGDVLNFTLPGTNKYHSQTYIWRRGHLLSKTIYDKNGNLLDEVSNTYSTIDQQQYDNIAIMANQNIQYAQGPVGAYSTSDPNIVNGSLFSFGNYNIQTAREALELSTHTIYDQGNPDRFQQNTTGYDYNPGNYLPDTILTNDSKGERVLTVIRYGLDFPITATPSIPAAEGLYYLQQNHILDAVVEKYQQLENIDGSNLRTIGGQLTYYHPNLPYPDQIDQLQLSAAETNFSPAHITYNSISQDPAYQPLILYDQYDAHGNLQQQHKYNNLSYSYIWDYGGAYPIASVSHASSSEVAYTSFEADGSGNWTIPGAPVLTSGAPSGSMAYPLANGKISYTISNTSKAYIVSYWSNGGSATVDGTSGKAGPTKNGWTYFEHLLPAGTFSVLISGTVSIDELRLYPADAQMVSYSYLPGVGLSGQCSANNTFSYFDYDGLGRQIDIRDQDRGIIKTFTYHYQN